jgi:hypothetical protein
VAANNYQVRPYFSRQLLDFIGWLTAQQINFVRRNPQPMAKQHLANLDMGMVFLSLCVGVIAGFSVNQCTVMHALLNHVNYMKVINVLSTDFSHSLNKIFGMGT